MKVAIISFAHMHANSYARCLGKIEGVELVSIADEDVKRGEKKAREFRTKYYQDYQEMLKKESPEAVIITSANAKHKDIALSCANSGKHILCEKPIATTLEDAKAMLSACLENEVIYQQAFPMRYSPPVNIIRKQVEQGTIGKVLAIKGTNHGVMPDPQEHPFFTDKSLSGGGAVMDHTVHVVDLMRWITGSEVREVYAEVDQLLHDNIDIDDCGILSLEFENEVFATLDPSWSRPKSFPTWGDLKLDFIGDKGVIFMDAFAQNISLYSDLDGRVFWNFWGDDLDLLMVRDFIDTVANKANPKVTGFDGLKALEVALAAYKSAQKGESVKIKNQR
ncbi:MAG: gfo/Idh/MocA family oxidoreductase [Armatimonadetes bacterium CG07_land_8_20_14_0_80_40_9]|nr:MAG: gfo/Idh/MocA family oxidoreductase [Armatimonadetes bacterium CG07_land_8_20_14_0_80_40_9]